MYLHYSDNYGSPLLYKFQKCCGDSNSSNFILWLCVTWFCYVQFWDGQGNNTAIQIHTCVSAEAEEMQDHLIPNLGPV